MGRVSSRISMGRVEGKEKAVSIEGQFDVLLVATMALREKQIQQNYRPIIGVHKWFARRPGTLFRGLLLAEFGDGRLEDLFFRSNDFPGVRIADPFMGGGTPLIEANRAGCDVDGFDINPMSAWIVREEIEHIDLPVYEWAARALIDALRAEIGQYYRPPAQATATRTCPRSPFSGSRCSTARSVGRPSICFRATWSPRTGATRRMSWSAPRAAISTRSTIAIGPGTACPAQARFNRPDLHAEGVASARIADMTTPILETPTVHSDTACSPSSTTTRTARAAQGRFFKKPDAEDLARADEAARRWEQLSPRFVPDETIPPGDETDRLHRWGYARYREMFNPRQLLGLELSCRLIADIEDPRIRHALATNLSDLLRYQNMLCRYDTMALKALDIFSVARLPGRTGAVRVELHGHRQRHRNECRFRGLVEHRGQVHQGEALLRVALRSSPYRLAQRPGPHRGGTDRRVARREQAPDRHPLQERDRERLGAAQHRRRVHRSAVLRQRAVRRADGFLLRLAAAPRRQRGRRLRPPDHAVTAGADRQRHPGPGLEHFTEGLATVYSRMARALKPGAPLAFTYHHNKLDAYCAVGVAILDAGLVCSASLPCPAEMGGSIHIHGTSSSIIDTVFVCRNSGTTPESWLFDTPERLVEIVGEDLAQLASTGRAPTYGDTRCIVLGHLTRMAVWVLRDGWEGSRPTPEKIAAVREWITGLRRPRSTCAVGAADRAARGPAVVLAPYHGNRRRGVRCRILLRSGSTRSGPTSTPVSMRCSGASNPSFWSCPRATGSSSSRISRTAMKP